MPGVSFETQALLAASRNDPANLLCAAWVADGTMATTTAGDDAHGLQHEGHTNQLVGLGGPLNNKSVKLAKARFKFSAVSSTRLRAITDGIVSILSRAFR